MSDPTTRRVIVFRNRLRPGIEEAYGPRADQIHDLAIRMPGFVSSRDYVAEDGERVAIVEFAGADELAAWRDHAEHRKAQAQGREQFYSEYVLQVCALIKESRFTAPASTPASEVVAAPVDLEGGCACSAVRYRARGTPFNATLCHCVDCRRASGAPVVGWVTFRAREIEWCGVPLKTRRSSDHAERGFCGECGAQLTFVDDDAAGDVDLTIASLDDPNAIAPRDHTYARSKLSWLATTDGRPQFTTTRKG